MGNKRTPVSGGTVVLTKTPNQPKAQAEPTKPEAKIEETPETKVETPTQAETKVETPETKVETPEAKEPAASVMPPEIAGNEALEAIWKSAEALATAAPELSAKMKAELLKLVKSDSKSKEADAWKAFNDEATKQVVALLKKLETEQKVSLKGRKIIVVFPDTGEPQYSHVSVNSKGTTTGKKASGGGGGIKSGGKVVDKGTGTEYNSRNEFAKAMGWKYEGRRTAMEAIEDPQDLTGKSLGFKNKVEQVDGKFIVTRIP